MKPAGRTILVLAVALLVAPILLRAAYFYRARPTLHPGARPPLAEVQIPLAPGQSIPQSVGEEQGMGILLVDLAHGNDVDPEELSFLIREILGRGWKVEFPGTREDLIRALKRAHALLVAVPRRAYSAEEQRQVVEFVERGGRLALLGDPARVADPLALNSLAQPFGLLASADFLYNLEENDGNFRYVFFDSFEPAPLTEGLERVVFYDVHSVQGAGKPLIWSDGNTLSSHREGLPLAAAAIDAQGKVLLLGDVSFLVEPFVAFQDNALLARNLSAFLASGERRFDLRDFPALLGPRTSLVYSGSALLAQAGRLGSFLRQQGLEVELQSWEAHLEASGLPEEKAEKPRLPAGPLLLLTTVGEAAELETWWGSRSLETLTGLAMADLDRKDTVLLHLRHAGARPIVSVVAHNALALTRLLEALQKHELDRFLLNPKLALVVAEKEPEETKEKPTATPDRKPTPEGEETATPGATPAETPTAAPTPEATTTPEPEASPTPGSTPTP